MGGPPVTVQIQYLFDEEIGAYRDYQSARLARPLSAPEFESNNHNNTGPREHVMRRERNLVATGASPSGDKEAPGSIASRYQNRHKNSRTKSDLVMNENGLLSYHKRG